MEHIRALVTGNQEIADGYYELEFVLPEGSPGPAPGQFLTIRVDEANIPLLRRPFAYSAWDAESRRAAIIYQRRGNATKILTGKNSHDRLDILSPLGNRFPLPSALPAEGGGGSRRPVLLAGGIGMGPMFFFAEDLANRGHDPLLIVGARSASLLPDLTRYSRAETLVATDDGSAPGSFHGNIIGALDHYAGRNEGDLSGNRAADGFELYACGPHVMMAAAQLWARQRNVPLWVSLEQTMGCAVGACMGCVVPVDDDKKYARVCSEGPIFPGGYIQWR